MYLYINIILYIRCAHKGIEEISISIKIKAFSEKLHETF